jgi:proline iminopeptidase
MTQIAPMHHETKQGGRDPLGLYPDIEPYHTGMLAVSELHQLYYEESGNPEGRPVVFLHGGPGGGTEPRHRRFFDPAHYRIVLFDQRGCGRSVPHASLQDNTTWDLVDDIESLRRHLGIDRWQVFGGSWGSTLALAYAEKYPERVSEMVLRGIFTFAKDEMEWFYGAGTQNLFPDAWHAFVHAIPEAERHDLIGAYHRRLTGDDRRTREHAARAWSTWECSVATLMQDPNLIAHCEDLAFTLAFARIECHYFVNGGFLARPTQLLDDIARIRHVPGVIVHGRYDVICPARNAWRLHRAWPEAELVIVEAAGHSANEAGISSALVRATDRFAGH